ncbi:MAG TPA: PAC2 family protein [Candidatus Binatia bacterium]|nr:PAC2 family protein [Candidatus Binatia bacterium]
MAVMWSVTKLGPVPKLKNPILIEGLPGIGNVGKVATDFIIDKVNAKCIYEFNGTSIPHSVFVNEKNLVELPKIELYVKQHPHRDILFLAGDVQPITEEACYDFCEKVLEICGALGCKDIIALGGIGLKQIPKQPKLYCTGTDNATVKDFVKQTGVSSRIYGIVGPIVGVSGVLVGLAGKQKKRAIALLAETYGHPMYLGVKGARELLKVLNKYLKLKLDLKQLDAEIEELEEEMMTRGPEKLPKMRRGALGETSYIG